MSETNNTIATPDHDTSAPAAIAEPVGAVSAVAEAQPSVDLAGLITTPILPDGEVVPSTQPIALSALILDSVEDLTEGAAPTGQPVEELVKQTALGGFGPSSAPRREKPPVELHEYDSTYFSITGRRAVTNNTIDFIFTRKAEVKWPEDRSTMSDDLVAMSSWMVADYAHDKYAEAIKELPTAPDFHSLNYSLVFNLKPVQLAEKTIRDLGGDKAPTGDDAEIYAFILLSPNAPLSEDQVQAVPRSIRINEHASTLMFFAVATLVKDCFNRGEVGTEPAQATDGDLTMEKIRRHYLKIVNDPVPVKPTQAKKEAKPKKPVVAEASAEQAEEVQPANNGNADPRDPRAFQARKEVAEPQGRPMRGERERDQREGGTQGRASDRLLHRHIELSTSRHEELLAQLRINQKQQGQILEGQKSILDANETLFSLMNLIVKTLEGKK